MTILLILAIWVAISALLVVLWGGYRHLASRHGMADFDVPREPAPKPALHR